jgi:hypothetical protein
MQPGGPPGPRRPARTERGGRSGRRGGLRSDDDGESSLLLSLGPFPFWQGTEPSPAVFEDLYRRAAMLGLEISAAPDG